MTVKPTGLDILKKFEQDSHWAYNSDDPDKEAEIAYREAAAALLDAELERIGPDEPPFHETGSAIKSNTLKHPLPANQARNILRATQRAAAREFFGVKE